MHAFSSYSTKNVTLRQQRSNKQQTTQVLDDEPHELKQRSVKTSSLTSKTMNLDPQQMFSEQHDKSKTRNNQEVVQYQDE